jgi:hypothetical protein
MESASSSIHCPRRPTLRRPDSLMCWARCSTPRSPTACGFFESLHRIVQIEPWLPRDKVMIDMLKSIGIEKGKPFNPDEKTKPR